MGQGSVPGSSSTPYAAGTGDTAFPHANTGTRGGRVRAAPRQHPCQDCDGGGAPLHLLSQGAFTEILKRDPSEALRSAAHGAALDRHARVDLRLPGRGGFLRRDPAFRHLRAARLPAGSCRTPAGALAHRGTVEAGLDEWGRKAQEWRCSALPVQGASPTSVETRSRCDFFVQYLARASLPDAIAVVDGRDAEVALVYGVRFLVAGAFVLSLISWRSRTGPYGRGR